MEKILIAPVTSRHRRGSMLMQVVSFLPCSYSAKLYLVINFPVYLGWLSWSRCRDIILVLDNVKFMHRHVLLTFPAPFHMHGPWWHNIYLLFNGVKHVHLCIHASVGHRAGQTNTWEHARAQLLKRWSMSRRSLVHVSTSCPMWVGM
jgi:hypothetical protein